MGGFFSCCFSREESSSSNRPRPPLQDRPRPPLQVPSSPHDLRNLNPGSLHREVHTQWAGWNTDVFSFQSNSYHRPAVAANRIAPTTTPQPQLPTTGVVYHQLAQNDRDFIRIVNRIEKSAHENMKVESIHRINNNLLWAKYQSQKDEVTRTYGHCDEMILFHGTKSSNIYSICLNNFDPRLHGTNKGHIFGHGVSFSPLASYASHYTDCSQDGGNTMILARVLVANSCVGDQYTKRPPEGYDTTVNHDSRVYVKYDNHTFYPEFLITYAGRLLHKNALLEQQNQKQTQPQLPQQENRPPLGHQQGVNGAQSSTVRHQQGFNGAQSSTERCQRQVKQRQEERALMQTVNRVGGRGGSKSTRRTRGNSFSTRSGRGRGKGAPR